MAWSSFAHLPTTEEEYWYILSHLKSGMSIHDVDSIIASYKKKEKVQHHYRSNLAKMGLFQINKGYITLNYDAKRLSKNKKLLRTILSKAVVQNQADEIKEVKEAIEITKSYVVGDIVDVLEINNQLVDRNSFIRWVRPIVVLYKIIDILICPPKKSTHYASYLQEVYLKISREFGTPVPLELVELELKKIDTTFCVDLFLNSILENFNMRFKIELLMMPSWATKSKNYKIGQDSYTHIKIKTDLLQED